MLGEHHAIIHNVDRNIQWPVNPIPQILDCSNQKPVAGQLRDEALLEAQEFDIVSVARGALANPDWPDRVAQGLPLEPFDYSMLRPRATLDIAEQWRERRAELAGQLR